MQKSWMWADESSNGVSGATIDIEDKRVMWFDEPGCACGDNSMVQSIDDFMNNGARFLFPPDDVHQEMQQFVVQADSE